MGTYHLRQICLLGFSVTLLLAGRAGAQKSPVYYDYLEDGQLRGGRQLMDRTRRPRVLNPAQVEPGEFPPSDWSVTTLVDNGPAANRIDLVFLGDGYTKSELPSYVAHVDAVLNVFFAEEPLAAYASYFNVHRVVVVSNESGVDEPDRGIDRDTALEGTYNCQGLHRRVCVNRVKASAAASFAPAVDQIIVLLNSSFVVGSGASSMAVLAGNVSDAGDLALHEFGHAFAGLADEYWGAEDSTYTGEEPSEPNVSTYDAFGLLERQTKWFRWLDLAYVDAFEGAYYCRRGIYRPTYDSKMLSYTHPFEEVNTEQLVMSIYKSVSPIDQATPPSALPLLPEIGFSVVPMHPRDHALKIQWSVDGVDVVGGIAPRFTPEPGSLPPGLHQVEVTVTDDTPRVRDQEAQKRWMEAKRQWQVSSADCNQNGLWDGQDFARATSQDCNRNGVPDECDIANATSQDCNSNGVPDECELPDKDCNGNGVLDDCELVGNDCNGNGVPDACELPAMDCNANGVLDDCELAVNDCNGNGVPDDCELRTHGLVGTYFGNTNFTGTIHARIDQTIDFSWMSVDTFSVRWTGYVHTPHLAGNYTFSAITDDPVRLWVNGSMIIDQWGNHDLAEWTGPIALQADTDYPIAMEYLRNPGPAEVHLQWVLPSLGRETLPPTNLMPNWDRNGNGVPDECEPATKPDALSGGTPGCGVVGAEALSLMLLGLCCMPRPRSELRQCEPKRMSRLRAGPQGASNT